MDQLIPVINKLQEVFEAIDPEGGEVGVTSLDLPRIVVVGSQSSGKSSVLESLVQKDFLPRGKDIVTRRPLILQLVHTLTSPTKGNSSGKGDVEEWGEFSHWPGKRFRDFLAIRREIELETERVAGSNKGISKVPIQLRICSPRLLNLTLVDLPGITKIPVGEQPPDIEMKTRQLILDHISKPNSIILAVTPANSDLVNSDALKIAREVDPTGLRTIGVLTKLDLMDSGTHAADILMNRAAFRLRLGFVGVVNRSQHDINVNKPIAEALRQEADFFKSHPHYRPIVHRCGTAFLAKELNKILMHHIRDQLPELRSRINELIMTTQGELTSLGDLGLPGQAHRGTLLLKLVTNYVTDFHAAIEGTLRLDPPPTDELIGGARINQIFHEVYANAIHQADDDLSPAEVRNAIRNTSGPRPALFVPEASFEVLARRQIAKLETPAQKCADLVFEELSRLAHRVERREFRRFPRLTARLVQVTGELLRERLEPTVTMIEGLVKIEMAYINTNHPDFCRTMPNTLSILNRFAHFGGGGGMAMGSRKVMTNLTGEAPIVRSVSEEIPSPSLSPSGGAPAAASPKQSSHEEGGLFAYLFRGNGHAVPNLTSSPTTATTTAVPATRHSPKKRTALAPPHTSISLSMPLTPQASPINGELASPTESTLSDREELETQLIMSLLNAYLAIVRRNLLDSVPKAIMYYLVNHVTEMLGTRLVTELYKEELFEELLEEDEGVIRQRARCKTALEAYRQAANVLSEVRDAEGSAAAAAMTTSMTAITSGLVSPRTVSHFT